MVTVEEDARFEQDTEERPRRKGRLRVLILLLVVALIIAATLCAFNRARPNPVEPKQAVARTLLPSTDVATPTDAQPTVQSKVAQPAGEATTDTPASTPENVASIATTVPTQESVAATPTTNLPIAPIEGSRAPDFTLYDLDGKEWRLRELIGQAVILNFWTTW